MELYERSMKFKFGRFVKVCVLIMVKLLWCRHKCWIGED